MADRDDDPTPTAAAPARRTRARKTKKKAPRRKRAAGGETAAEKAREDAGEAARQLATRFKEALEGKDWKNLQELLAPLPSIWLYDVARRTPEFVQEARTRLDAAEDVELVLSRLVSANVESNAVSASLTARLLWSEAKTWEQNEIEFDLHLGFAKVRNAWNFSFLGVSRPSPEPLPEQPEPDYFAVPSSFERPAPWAVRWPYFGGGTFEEAPPEAYFGLTSPFRGFRVGYFAGQPYFETFGLPGAEFFAEHAPAPAPPAPGPIPGGRLVLLYVPILVPAEAAARLAG